MGPYDACTRTNLEPILHIEARTGTTLCSYYRHDGYNEEQFLCIPSLAALGVEAVGGFTQLRAVRARAHCWLERVANLVKSPKILVKS